MSKFSCGSEKLRGVSWGWSLRDKETAGYRWEDGSAGLAPTKGFARTPSLLAEGRTPKGCCRKIKEIAQCLSTASEAAEAQQQDRDAPACGELQQNHSQFRWGISPHPLEQPWKKKIKNRKGEKPTGLNTALLWTWAQELWFAKGHLLMPTVGLPLSSKVKWGIAPSVPYLLPGLQLWGLLASCSPGRPSAHASTIWAQLGTQIDHQILY